MEAIQITLPSSKSISNRWLVLDFMSQNGIRIKNLSSADDTQLFKRLLRQAKLGRRHTYDCRDAGTAARFLVALLAVTPGTHTVTGSPRLCQRPIGPLVDALRSVGCKIDYMENEGYLPLKIDGVVPTETRLKIDGTQSSQFVSALLLAAAAMPTGMAVEVVGNDASAPYIRMTLDALDQSGIEYVYKGNPPAYFVTHTLPQIEMYSIEKDWSAASYFYNVTLLSDKPLNLHMSGLAYPSMQGDSAVYDIYAQLGIRSRTVGQAIEIDRDGDAVDYFEYDFFYAPDLFPSVAVACAAKGIETKLTGLTNLRIKESDRIEAVSTELRKLGVNVELIDDTMLIHPSTMEYKEPIDSHNDHRIAMAFSTLKPLFPNLEILNPEVVSKSFPNFYEMLGRTLD